jgi:hypothetical protein
VVKQLAGTAPLQLARVEDGFSFNLRQGLAAQEELQQHGEMHLLLLNAPLEGWK